MMLYMFLASMKMLTLKDISCHKRYLLFRSTLFVDVKILYDMIYCISIQEPFG